MGHTASHKNTRGSGAKNKTNIENKIKLIQEANPNYSYAEARFLAITGNTSIPTFINDNGDPTNMRMQRIEIDPGFRGKGKKYETFFFDEKGNKYNVDGELLESVDPTSNSGTTADAIRNARAQRLKKYGRKKQGGVLRFPAESLTQHTDYLQIDIERYAEIGRNNYISDTGGSSRYVIGNRRQNRAGMTQGANLSRRPLINDGTILLPIPSNVQDNNNVQYGESKMNGLQAAGISAAEGITRKFTDLVKGDIKGIDFKGKASDEIDNLGNKIKAGLGGDPTTAAAVAGDILTKQLTASAANVFDANVTANQLLARASGEIINPNLEILFSDVTIRNFQFRYKLTPRNKYESEQIKLIIRAFKRNMAPQAIGSDGASDFFLRTPNVFKLRYRSGNRDHPFLNKFKQCFLSDMQTTYTGEGVYSTYDDGTPVSILLSLSFKEIQPIYDIDYDEFPGTGGVGY